MKEHRDPESRFPGLVAEGVCENGHRATIADRGLPNTGFCSECGKGVTWYKIPDDRVPDDN
jgi:hypothetical protein